MSKRVVSFHYVLTNGSGEVLDSSRGSAAFSYLEGAHQIIPGLEKEIIHLKTGDKKVITIPAHSAYGERKDNLIIKVPKSKLPAQDIQVGQRFRGGNDQHAPVFLVINVEENEVTLDGNHPLAGQDLTFDLEIIETREATKDEIDHGHAHGEGGAHH